MRVWIMMCVIAALPTELRGRILNYQTNIPPAFTTRKQVHQKGKSIVYASLRPGETFIRVCLRPTKAACFCVRKCKKLSADCCRHSKVCMTSIHSPFPCHTYTQNAVCTMYIRVGQFSESEITVCGCCKMSKKLNWPFFFFAKILNHFSPPYIVKKETTFLQMFENCFNPNPHGMFPACFFNLFRMA